MLVQRTEDGVIDIRLGNAAIDESITKGAARWSPEKKPGAGGLG
jgi:hypothetical protein